MQHHHRHHHHDHHHRQYQLLHRIGCHPPTFCFRTSSPEVVIFVSFLIITQTLGSRTSLPSNLYVLAGFFFCYKGLPPPWLIKFSLKKVAYFGGSTHFFQSGIRLNLTLSIQTGNLSTILHDHILGQKILHTKNAYIWTIFTHNKSA